MTIPFHERRIWAVLCSLCYDYSGNKTCVLPPLDFASDNRFPTGQIGSTKVFSPRYLLPIRDSDGHWLRCWIKPEPPTKPTTLAVELYGSHMHFPESTLTETQSVISSYITKMETFKGLKVSWDHCRARGSPEELDVCSCRTIIFTLAARSPCLQEHDSSPINVFFWRQFWHRLAHFFKKENDGSSLGELQREEESGEVAAAKNDVAEDVSFLMFDPKNRNFKRDALKNQMDRVKIISHSTLVEAKAAADKLLARKNRLETLEPQLRQVVDVCVELSERLHKLEEPAQLLESVKDIVNGDGVSVPLPEDLETLKTRGGIKMVQRTLRGLSHLKDAFDPWVLDVQTELQEVEEELAARNRDIKEFQEELGKLGNTKF